MFEYFKGEFYMKCINIFEKIDSNDSICVKCVF